VTYVQQEAIIASLKDYNDGLYHLLSAIERRSLREGLGPELVTIDDLVDLRNLAHASEGRGSVPAIVSLKARRMKILEAKPGFSGAHQFPATLLSENMQIPRSSIILDSSSRRTDP
jgi:hypothetical protein